MNKRKPENRKQQKQKREAPTVIAVRPPKFLSLLHLQPLHFSVSQLLDYRASSSTNSGGLWGSLRPRQIEFTSQEKALSEILEVEKQLSGIEKNSIVIQNHYVC
ncbi:hypothetical protein AKJ16_DCAP21136 [Drosera capensis]